MNGVNAHELRKKDKLQLHCPQELMFESSAVAPMESSPKEDPSGVAFYKYLADDAGRNEDFNYHKYTLLKSHVG